MSLVPATINIERDTETDDNYGGVTAVSANVYTGMSATINYPNLNAVQRLERGAGGAVGPGVVTQYQHVVKFEPIPAATILVNDRVYVPATGHRFKVVGVRPYEFTLQLDCERLA